VLDDVLVVAHLDDAFDEQAGQVDVVGVDRAAVNQLVDLGHGDVRRHRHDRIEVAGRAVEAQVAVDVADGGAHDRQVGAQRALEDVSLAVDLAHLLPLGNDRPDARGCVEAGDPGAARADPFRERSLRRQLDLHLALHVKVGEVGVPAHEAADHARDLAVLEQHRQPLALVAAVVADDGQVPDPAARDRLDARLRVAAQAEAARHDRHAVAKQARQGALHLRERLLDRRRRVAQVAIASSNARPSAATASSSSASVMTRGGAK
jgi:hypothetical protein